MYLFVGRTVRLVFLDIRLLALENAPDILDLNDWFGLSGAGIGESSASEATLLSGLWGIGAWSGDTGLLAVCIRVVALILFFNLAGIFSVTDSRLWAAEEERR